MADGVHTTLDGFGGQQDRYRREFARPIYRHRAIVAKRPRLINDISPRQPSNHIREAISSSLATAAPQMLTNSNNVQSRTLAPLLEPAIATGSSIPNNSIATDLTQHQFKHSVRSKALRVGRSKLQVALITLAALLIVCGLYGSLVGWRTNHIAQVQAAKLTQQANKAAVSTKANSASSSVPSTIKPSPAAVANYVVAPNLPKYLIIPKLGVDARVLSVGVNTEGALETPDNVYDTAWYNESAEPGQPGAMLIDGHVSSWTAHGVFYGIKTLVAGDIIKVERGDGTIFTYTVVKNQVYPSGNVNMTSAITPVVAGQPGLNLITCTGDVTPGTSQFNERIVVYATLQQS